MVKFGPPKFFVSEDEAYAGTSTSDWKAIVDQMEFLKPIKLNDIEPKDQNCDICRGSFGPSDDGSNPESPVALLCGHVFGNDCISAWIMAGGGHDDILEAGEPFRVSSPIRSETFDDLLPPSAIHSIKKPFTCPKCRKEFTAPTIGEQQAPAIEARLRFWDLAYAKLGITRSRQEETCRHDLSRFVEQQTKAKRVKALSANHRRSFDRRAQVAAMRFALRRARWPPTSLHLRDAFFNLACYPSFPSSSFFSSPYNATSYENLPIPIWCWQFDRLERGMNPELSLDVRR